MLHPVDGVPALGWAVCSICWNYPVDGLHPALGRAGCSIGCAPSTGQLHPAPVVGPGVIAHAVPCRRGTSTFLGKVYLTFVVFTPATGCIQHLGLAGCSICCTPSTGYLHPAPGRAGCTRNSICCTPSTGYQHLVGQGVAFVVITTPTGYIQHLVGQGVAFAVPSRRGN